MRAPSFPSGEDVSDFIWRWRCKIFPRKDALAGPKAADLESSINSAEKDDDDPNARSGREPGFGSETVAKIMYESKDSRPPDFSWVDYPPKQLSKSAARAQDRVAIKVFKIKNRDKPSIGGRLPLRHHMIEVQNPVLVTALEPIVKKENVLLDVNETAQFEHPFRPLWFCQDDIAALCRETDAAAPLKGYLQLLLRLMDDMFAEMRVKRRHLQASGLVDFRTAWSLFPKGSVVYSYGMNSEFLCKVETTAYTRKKDTFVLELKAKVLRFNGEEFVWDDRALHIPHFLGNTPVRDLDYYPLDFHPDKDDIMRRLVARGKKALDLQGLKYCCYNGIALHAGKECMSKHNVEGRVLIDVVGYNKFHLSQGKRENKSPENERNYAAERRRRMRRRRSAASDDEDDDDKKGGGSGWLRLSEEDQERNKQELLEREQDLGFMAGVVGGYALKNKLWVQFYIEDIKPMIWNDTAYEHLVYDDQQKDLVLSFVENHNLATTAKASASTSGKTHAAAAPTGDVILGKGQGLIILLSGPPGTGKTLTAEAVADRTHRPLFYLQAEDLGINAASLGANVKRVFEMATEWDAVVLLDEADVFMAERNPNDIHRNELVSIFLRELEYFRGIIFLTTNLYHTIDSAFRSRVSLHLLFQPLDRDARETVWYKFLQRLPAQEAPRVEEIKEGGEAGAAAEAEAPPAEKPLDDEDVKQLALWQLNGREIKNAVKMVRSWCDHKGYVMTLERLESGIRVTSPHASKEGDVDKDLYE